MTDHVFDLREGWNSLAADLLYAFMEGGVSQEELGFYERRIRRLARPTSSSGCTGLRDAVRSGRVPPAS